MVSAMSAAMRARSASPFSLFVLSIADAPSSALPWDLACVTAIERVVPVPDRRGPIEALEATDDEMTLCDPLKMVHENQVDRRAANRAEDRQRACGKSFRGDYSEPRHDLGYETVYCRR